MKRQITTRATAECESNPDFASVRVKAVGEGDTPETAHANAEDRAATIHQSLISTIIPEEQIHKSGVRVEEVSEILGHDSDAEYRSTETLHVECDPETVSEIFKIATGSGGTVSQVRFKLYDDVRDSLQEEAISAALNRSRKKAERIATVEGLEIDGVQEVTTSEAETDALFEEEWMEETNLHPGPITVSETVEVTYEFSDG